ncbi:MAG: cytochrome c biogenesis protein ResB [Syntrophales bacterium]|nr:cytochrome c biogenesis protein ResB [Syntrophales bacterium]
MQLNRVYTSVWFLSLVLLITASLSLTVWDQGSAAVKARRYRGRPVSPEGFKNFSNLAVPGPGDITAVTETVRNILNSKGFKICGEDRNEATSLVFSKNATGRWGSFILHAGFLCVVIAGLYNLAFQQRGFVELIETETFTGRANDWLTSDYGLLARDFDLDFQVHLKRFIPTYWDNDKVKSLQSKLIIGDEGGQKNVLLGVNSPVRHRGVTLYQSLDYGYTLTFVLSRPAEEPVATHFSLDAPGRKNMPFVGKTDFPTTDYMLDMKFYPNLIEPSFYLAFPGVDLTVTKKDTVLYKGRVLFTQRARIGDEALHFAGIHYWSGIAFVRNSGLPLVYTGFMIASIGAFLIYFVIPREIHIRIAREGDETVVKVGGRARKYQALFADEFEKICQAIKAGLRSE